jgi:hypothetical protein
MGKTKHHMIYSLNFLLMFGFCLLTRNIILTINLKYEKKNDNINLNLNQLSMQLKLKIQTFARFTEEFQNIEKNIPKFENFYNTNQNLYSKVNNLSNFLDNSISEKDNNNKENVKKNEKEKTRRIYGFYNNSKKSMEFTAKNKEDTYNTLIAQGVFKNTRYSQGWDKLRLKTFSSSNGNPLIQCYSAGFIEGAISTKEIYYYYTNIHIFFKKAKKSVDDIKSFYSIINKNLRERIQKENFQTQNFNDSEFKQLAYIACLLAQINGLYQGYNSQAEANKKLDLMDFYFINSEGNFGDLKDYMKVNKMKFDTVQDFYKKENLIEFYNSSEINVIWKNLIRKGHCSAIIKMTEDLEGQKDIIAGHNTWSDYSEMIRVLKFHSFAFEGENGIFNMKPKTINFSSYPGVLFSGDDFYLLDSKVGVLQTTLTVINKFSYKNLIDLKKYIPEFMRLQICNFTSNSAKDWVDTYRSFQNHMYITQWLVIDYNLLKKMNQGEKINEGLVYLVEEAPKSILFKDLTETILEKKFYGSFNVSYFPEHQNILGMSHFNKVNFFDKDYNPRYYILEKLQENIKDVEGFKKVIMYNGFGKSDSPVIDDPSFKDPGNGISSRDDLSGNMHGGIDFKVKLLIEILIINL